MTSYVSSRGGRGSYVETLVGYLSDYAPCKKRLRGSEDRVGVDVACLPREYVTDSHGMTALYQAMVLKDPAQVLVHGRKLLSMPACPEDVLWAKEEDVSGALSALDGSDASIDRFVSLWTGVGVADLNNKKELCKYVAHLHSWKASLMGTPSEGWFENAFLPQRIRSLAKWLVCEPSLSADTLSKMDPSEAYDRVLRELVLALQSFRTASRLNAVYECTDKASSAIAITVESRNIVAAVKSLGNGEELCLPIGSKGHAMYTSLIKTTDAAGSECVLMRIHNLGEGSEKHPHEGLFSKVLAKDIVVPMACLETSSHPSLQGLLENVIHFAAKQTVDSEGFYGLLEHFEQSLSWQYTEKQRTVRHPVDEEYAHKAQKVGNCVLKNHSASMAARLGKALFKDIKAYETTCVKNRLKPVGLSDKMVLNHERTGRKRGRS